MIIILIIAIIIAASAKNKKAGKFKYNPNETWPFEKKKILTATEQKLYFTLCEALPNHCIFSQVQLSQLIQVKKGNDYKAWFNRINRMSADFVITDKTFNTVAVIELDDKSHEKPERIEADKKKDKALASAGIETIRWKVNEVPTADDIKKAFQSL
jgi:very-short-patch-repair endonuclease